MLADFLNIAMRKLFSLEPGWHKQIDIVQNNYALGHKMLKQGKYNDALWRLKLVLLINDKHTGALLDLARVYVATKNRNLAEATVNKLLRIDSANGEAAALKRILAAGKDISIKDISIKDLSIKDKAINNITAAAFTIEQEFEAKKLYDIHKKCFPIYWKEKEISDMLLVSGTKAWLAAADSPTGMVITRMQFEQAEILTIAVLPDFQNNGIARMLMNEAEKDLRAAGVKKIFLEVAENNKSAYALYLKIGYQETKRRKAYYKQADNNFVDAIVMCKEFS